MKRGDREIEHLFNALQNTIDAQDRSIEKCRNLSESNLPLLKIKLDETLALCENVLTRDQNTEAVNKWRENCMQFSFRIFNEFCLLDSQAEKLGENRAERADQWQRFIDDMKHKQSCVDNTFEEKEEELREFYSDLERKLHIHK